MAEQNNLETAKAALIELCKDFNSQEYASEQIKTLMYMLGDALLTLEEDEFDPEHVRNKTFQVTYLMWFLTALQEKVKLISEYEDRIKQNKS